MDLSLTALNLPTSPLAQRTGQAAAAPDPRRSPQAEGTPGQVAGQAKAAKQDAEAPDAARESRTDSLSLEARIKFAYEQSHRVMQVHDSKGVLIYQVPPKGALQLILQEEAKPAQLEDQA